MSAAGEKIQLERVTKGILPYKMSAAGENLRFQSTTKRILPYKMSAAGEKNLDFDQIF